jgi:hypothetical protein
MKKDILSNLFKAFKKKNTDREYIEESSEPIVVDEKSDHPNPKVVEYHETLYSDRPNQHRSNTSFHRKLIFKDVQSVESDIDDIDKEHNVQNGNIEKKVDSILSRDSKKDTKEPSHRKPANVIYVVSKPQPGQVKGDWAVRSHYKIFSHHRTKQAAIKNARKIASEKEATVLVQNTDGTFSTGFKPRIKKK